MTIPNAITVGRVLLLPPMLWAFAQGPEWLFLTLFFSALMGDLADGWLARRLGQESTLGQILDPVADKLFYFSLLAALAFRGELPWAALGFLAGSQLLLGLGGLWVRVRTGEWRFVKARPLGAASSTLMSAGLIALVVGLPSLRILLYAGIALSYAAAAEYLRLLCRPAPVARSISSVAAGSKDPGGRGADDAAFES